MLTRARAAQGCRPRQPPFFGSECMQLKHEWRRLARRGGPTSKAIERRYHSLVRAKKREWLLTRLDEVARDFHSNPRLFWRTLWGPPPPLPSPRREPDVWNEYLASLCSPRAPTAAFEVPLDVCPILRHDPVVGLNEPFSLVEIEVCLDHLNTSRAPGFSGLPAELFRFAQPPTPDGEPPAPHLLAPCLRNLLNAIFESGSIPKQSNILTISHVVKDTRGDVLS
jgi:hypothetical protein